MSDSGNDEQRRAEETRLWEQLIYEGEMVFQIGNIFLLAESLLVVAYSALLASSDTNRASEILAVLRALATFGLITSASWCYMAHRQLQFAQRLEDRAKSRMADYAESVSYASSPGLESKLLLAYLMPVVAGIMWTLFLVIV